MQMTRKISLQENHLLAGEVSQCFQARPGIGASSPRVEAQEVRSFVEDKSIETTIGTDLPHLCLHLGAFGAGPVDVLIEGYRDGVLLAALDHVPAH